MMVTTHNLKSTALEKLFLWVFLVFVFVFLHSNTPEGCTTLYIYNSGSLTICATLGKLPDLPEPWFPNL